MANTSDIRRGLCINHNNDVYAISEFQHVKPGKGNAFVRTKLKSMTTGRVVDHTFPAGHKIDVVRVERRKFQFLYKEESGFVFMDTETYEQVTIEEKMIDNALLIKEEMIIDIIYNTRTDLPLTVEMPQYINLEVVYTEPGVKGDTATNTLKPAKLETGFEAKVPLFINVGDKVKIDTATGGYMERVKQ